MTWMVVAIVAPIFHGISFCRCGPLHGGGLIGGSPRVSEVNVPEDWTMLWRKLGALALIQLFG